MISWIEQALDNKMKLKQEKRKKHIKCLSLLKSLKHSFWIVMDQQWQVVIPCKRHILMIQGSKLKEMLRAVKAQDMMETN